MEGIDIGTPIEPGTRFNGNTNTLECDTCGEHCKVELPMPINTFVYLINGFDIAHRHDDDF